MHFHMDMITHATAYAEPDGGTGWAIIPHSVNTRLCQARTWTASFADKYADHFVTSQPYIFNLNISVRLLLKS